MSKKSRILIATGGTGGHVFPAIALAEYLEKNYFDIHVTTDSRGETYLSSKNCSHIHYECKVILRENLASLSILKRLFLLLPLCWKMRRYVIDLDPQAVIAFGGYPTFPLCVAAWLARVPLYLHEQNAIAGKVNRIFSRICKVFMVSFPNMDNLIKLNNKRVMTTGNFVRKEFLKTRGRYSLPKDEEKFNILVLGGSQGAKDVTELTLTAINKLPNEIKKRLRLVLQSPKSYMSTVQKNWPTYRQDSVESQKISGEVSCFFDDMPERLCNSHLVVSRSGATTVWEILATKRPAIFIPFPFAADNHQFYNAKYLLNERCSWILEQNSDAGEIFFQLLTNIFNSPEVLLQKHKSLLKFHDHIFAKNPLEFALKILQGMSLSNA